jgi:hypothetical protein
VRARNTVLVVFLIAIISATIGFDFDRSWDAGNDDVSVGVLRRQLMRRNHQSMIEDFLK